VSDSVSIELVAAGSNSPPSISIVNPADGEVIIATPVPGGWEVLITLQAFASDPDATDILLITWSVSKEGGPYMPVGTGQTVTDVPFFISDCFGEDFSIPATVTDSVNTRSDIVAIQVSGGVC